VQGTSECVRGSTAFCERMLNTIVIPLSVSGQGLVARHYIRDNGRLSLTFVNYLIN
jgi:hypothetical protein